MTAVVAKARCKVDDDSYIHRQMAGNDVNARALTEPVAFKVISAIPMPMKLTVAVDIGPNLRCISTLMTPACFLTAGKFPHA